MFSIGGIFLVFACVIAGYLMEKGKIGVLLQPAELLIIGGAAIGTVLTANPMRIIKKIAAGLITVVKGSPFYQQAISGNSEDDVRSSQQITQRGCHSH